MTAWQLKDLGVTNPQDDGRPADAAYAAMVQLISEPFLRVTRLERSRQAHRGSFCQPVCELCWDIALKHAQWATDKLHSHLTKGPPSTRGEPVRDWLTILDWVTSPDRGRALITDIRTGIDRRLAPDDPRLPLVLALRTQLLPSATGARGPRKAREAVGDARRSVVALQQQWAVKPDRDLRTGRRFAPLWTAHRRGCDLLVAVLKSLDHGETEPYRAVLGRPEALAGDEAALRALIRDMLADPDLRAWFLREVDARQSYNQDRAARRFRPADIESMSDPDGVADG
jgi:hypothetical protein